MLLIKHHLETTTREADGQKQTTSWSHVCLQSSTHHGCVLGRQTTGLKSYMRRFRFLGNQKKTHIEGKSRKTFHFLPKTSQSKWFTTNKIGTTKKWCCSKGANKIIEPTGEQTVPYHNTYTSRVCLKMGVLKLIASNKPTLTFMFSNFFKNVFAQVFVISFN